MGRNDLASGHNHDLVDVTLDRHHLEGESSRNAVPIAVEGDSLVLVHRDRRTDHTGIEPILGKRRRRDLFRGETAADLERTEGRLDGSLVLGLAALAEVHVQFIEIPHAGHRSGEPTLHGLDGSLGVGLLVAPSRHAEEGIEDVVAGQLGVAGMELAFASLKDERGHGPGVVPPDLLGDAAEELEGPDHAFKDRLGALKGRARTNGAFESAQVVTRKGV